MNKKAFNFFVNNQLSKTGIPTKWKDACLDDFEFNIRKKLGTDPLFLFGEPGVGKTHYLASLIRFIVENSIENKTKKIIKFIPIPVLLYQLRCSYGEGAEEKEYDIISRYTNLDWLFLDDFGADRPSDWVRSSLYLIVDELYRNEKKLCISSNISLNQIAKLYDDRLASRITEMCKISKFQGQDRRKN